MRDIGPCGNDRQHTQTSPVLSSARPGRRVKVLLIAMHASMEVELEGAKATILRPKQEGTASIISSVVNLANVIMGVGILALPIAFSEAGWLLGMLLMLGSAALGVLSLHLLGESARRVGVYTFYAVCEAAVPHFGVVIDCAVVLNSFLVCSSYLIVATDSLEAITSSGADVRDVWTAISAVLVVPLVLLRKQDALKFTSFLAVVVLIFITVLSVIFAQRLPNNPTLSPCTAPAGSNATAAAAVVNAPGPCGGATITAVGSNGLGFVRAFLTFVSAFKCQQNLLPIAEELRDPTTSRILLVSSLSIGLALVLYMLVAFAGYFTFGSLVKGDLLKSYPDTSVLIDVARAGIAIVVLTSYPLSSFAMRASMRSLLQRCACATKLCGAGSDADARVDCVSPGIAETFVLEPLPCTVSVGFIAFTLILGMLISNLGFIVELGGVSVELFYRAV